MEAGCTVGDKGGRFLLGVSLRINGTVKGFGGGPVRRATTRSPAQIAGDK